MNTPTHVMAATDLSGPSRLALERAARVATAIRAECTAVHVVKASELDDLAVLLGQPGAAAREQLLAETRVQLAEFVGHCRVAGAEVEARVCAGPVVDTLVAEAGALDAGLVVVGARGGGFLRHLVIGSTAERVLRKLARPVLVVRQIPYDGYRRVLVGVYFSAASAAALRAAVGLAPGADLVLVHAFEVPFEGKLHFAGVDEAAISAYRRRAEREARARLGEFAAGADLPSKRVQLIVGHGDPSRVLLEREQEEGCDLLVVGKRGKTVVEELLLGSVTKHVLAEATTDVLVVPPQPEGAL
jgi:nucleotide-binding universal stress UspA family protein